MDTKGSEQPPRAPQAPPEVDNTLELFAAGIRYAADWHLLEAQKWEDKGWSEWAKHHREVSEELQEVAKKVSRP